MIEESSSFLPSFVNTAPRPALKIGLSSISLIAAFTASIAVPPLAKTLLPARRAFWRPAWYSACCSGVKRSAVMLPAPPWITRRYCASAAFAATANVRPRAIARSCFFMFNPLHLICLARSARFDDCKIWLRKLLLRFTLTFYKPQFFKEKRI